MIARSSRYDLAAASALTVETISHVLAARDYRVAEAPSAK
jgi:hypothetical protein